MIGVLETGANLLSIKNALQRLGASWEKVDSCQFLQKTTHLIIPGVSSAKRAMIRLQKAGLIAGLLSYTRPILGICSGMQILFEFSEEKQTTCLGKIKGKVEKFSSTLKYSVPHMGWNQIHVQKPYLNDPLLRNIPQDSDFYFAHSYYIAESSSQIAYSDYDIRFSSIVKKDLVCGVQFHPEKSSTMGGILLNNFLRL